ncbi:hypothetical protein VTJ49DRAFT_851 [Mycothermus thermophilus]|uniref:HRDC domain-containing protein n=1 Tax=Humicola insolens TaxID=85995 RepID=A0ABR3VPG8_HUMIN
MRARLVHCLRPIRSPGVGLAMDSSLEFKPLRDSVHSSLIGITRSVNTLANEDLEFQRTVHPSVSKRLDKNSRRLLHLAAGVLKSAANLTSQRKVQLDDADDVEIQWRGVVDVVDSLLEKSDTCLDEFTGLVKRKDAPTPESGRELNRSKLATVKPLDSSLKHANILKPQKAFEVKTDNFDTGPWKPPLTTKPHALVPLEESLETFVDQDNHTQYKHPYEYEITNMQYPSHVFEKRDPIPYPPMETTEAIWVDTYEGVLEMLEELKKAPEIAVDLEHHDYRTYRGLLSLMQISTREKDWIVDTLVPWRHKLEVLNEVFADPKIVKVLHGAFMDAVWLQRDLGLYLVGLFDTFHASDVLSYPTRSLAFLLKKFVDFDAAKQYQLADWRIRPLPEEMFYYARSDTHYLLYIYDMLRNELVELVANTTSDENPIERVLRKSKEVALSRYENPWFDEETGAGNRSWLNTLLRSSSLYNSEQFAVYKAVYKWRDDVARKEDESPAFIMSQRVLDDIARIMPTDMKALWSLLASNARDLKGRLHELFEVIQQARARGENGPTMLEFFSRRTTAALEPLVGSGISTAVVPRAEEAPPLDLVELKSEQSQLWGDVALNSRLDGTAKNPPLDDRSRIPLYTFDFASVKEEVPAAAQPTPPSEPAKPAVQEEEAFTLRTRRKRKADEVEDGGPTPAAESTLDKAEMDSAAAAEEPEEAAVEDLEEADDAEASTAEVTMSQNLSKKEKRRLRREAKKANNSEAVEEGEEEDQEEEQPFDYTKAASVLHAAKEDGASAAGSGSNRTFDPYVKRTSDAPKGARKMNYERAGRTATFKK